MLLDGLSMRYWTTLLLLRDDDVDVYYVNDILELSMVYDEVQEMLLLARRSSVVWTISAMMIEDFDFLGTTDWPTSYHHRRRQIGSYNEPNASLAI